ncbi:MAG TPA: hypothetical protein PL152_10235 [Steroidobacteraceae bacterium]|nr:hypothetical protein [Steroidobacteraceae bacterium]HQR49704.1 hypothetical protein [Steroidobacteraceae bacterium]
MTIRSYIESAAETEKRDAEYMEWKKKTIAQMDKQSGDRAEFREILEKSLLHELKFRK